jgi:hypothetical protein
LAHLADNDALRSTRHTSNEGRIRAGKVLWCEDCECWVPVEEMRPDPWGGNWQMCIDCIADQGLDDNLLDPAEAEEEKQHMQDQGELL